MQTRQTFAAHNRIVAEWKILPDARVTPANPDYAPVSVGDVIDMDGDGQPSLLGSTYGPQDKVYSTCEPTLERPLSELRRLAADRGTEVLTQNDFAAFDRRKDFWCSPDYVGPIQRMNDDLHALGHIAGGRIADQGVKFLRWEYPDPTPGQVQGPSKMETPPQDSLSTPDWFQGVKGSGWFDKDLGRHQISPDAQWAIDTKNGTVLAFLPGE